MTPPRVHVITTQLEFERIADRSARMVQLLDQKIDQVELTTDLASLQKVIRDVEQTLLTENHEWWILLSFRKPILPT